MGFGWDFLFIYFTYFGDFFFVLFLISFFLSFSFNLYYIHLLCRCNYVYFCFYFIFCCWTYKYFCVALFFIFLFLFSVLLIFFIFPFWFSSCHHTVYLLLILLVRRPESSKKHKKKKKNRDFHTESLGGRSYIYMCVVCVGRYSAGAAYNTYRWCVMHCQIGHRDIQIARERKPSPVQSNISFFSFLFSLASFLFPSFLAGGESEFVASGGFVSEENSVSVRRGRSRGGGETWPVWPRRAVQSWAGRYVYQTLDA